MNLNNGGVTSVTPEEKETTLYGVGSFGMTYSEGEITQTPEILFLDPDAEENQEYYCITADGTDRTKAYTAPATEYITIKLVDNVLEKEEEGPTEPGE